MMTCSDCLGPMLQCEETRCEGCKSGLCAGCWDAPGQCGPAGCRLNARAGQQAPSPTPASDLPGVGEKAHAPGIAGGGAHPTRYLERVDHQLFQDTPGGFPEIQGREEEKDGREDVPLFSVVPDRSPRSAAEGAEGGPRTASLAVRLRNLWARAVLALAAAAFRRYGWRLARSRWGWEVRREDMGAAIFTDGPWWLLLREARARPCTREDVHRALERAREEAARLRTAPTGAASEESSAITQALSEEVAELSAEVAHLQARTAKALANATQAAALESRKRARTAATLRALRTTLAEERRTAGLHFQARRSAELQLAEVRQEAELMLAHGTSAALGLARLTAQVSALKVQLQGLHAVHLEAKSRAEDERRRLRAAVDAAGREREAADMAASAATERAHLLEGELSKAYVEREALAEELERAQEQLAALGAELEATAAALEGREGPSAAPRLAGGAR